MEFSINPLIYLAIFGAVLLMVEGVYLLAFGKSIRLGGRMNRRLEMIEKGKSRNDVLEQLRKELNQHMSSNGIPLYGLLADKARKANIAFSPRVLLLLMAALSGFAFAALSAMTEAEPAVAGLLAVAFGVGGVYFWVANKAKKRLAMIEEQLPDAIELIVRGLRVGHPFASALGNAAKEIPDPLGTEFGMIADEAAYGRDVSEALAEFAERVDMQDLRFLAVAVAIQMKSGGNLAEILEGLCKVVRARFKLFRKVRAITAEAKWSGMFLSGFPIFAMIMITLIKPDYYDDVKEHAMFIPVALIVFAFLAVNILYMRKTVDIKV